MPGSGPSPVPVVYQVRVVVAGISPLIWRRLLVPAEATIADLHAIVQTAFGWSGEHLHHFTVHGAQYGVCYDGGPVFRDDAYRVRLASLGLREGERFSYACNFFSGWRLDLRVEQITDLSQGGSIRGAPAVAAPARRSTGTGPGISCSGPSPTWCMRRSCAPRRSQANC